MYDFYKKLARVINAGQSNSIIVAGNIYDLFFDGDNYVPLVPYLLKTTAPSKRIQLTYELNGPIRIADEEMRKLCAAWVKWKIRLTSAAVSKPKGIFDMQTWQGLLKSDKGPLEEFQEYLNTAMANPQFALEFLRQLCYCSRETLSDSDLLIFIEAADMLVPTGNGDVASLNDLQLKRVAIIQDWFCDPAFMNSRDAVCLLAESKSLVHPRISRLPQVVAVEVPSPTTEDRKHFISQFCQGHASVCPACHQKIHSEECPGPLQWNEQEQDRAAKMTAGLSIHALRKLLAESAYAKATLTTEVLSAAVEDFIQAQVGDDVVEFSRPHHKLDAVMGNAKLVAFARKELIPRFQDGSLSGCAVAGPIGGGKTYIFEAVAAEIGIPVMVLKNLRSQWYGQTDVIFERLKRALEALEKVVIVIDEADTAFGGVGKDTHETERRLTAKVQQMMSDPRLKGRVIWLLMTARIHLLSPDIRRPGRAGDLIIPVLDPIGADRDSFIRWTLQPFAEVLGDKMQQAIVALGQALDESYSAAAFATLRSHLKSSLTPGGDVVQQLVGLVREIVPADIGKTREYQMLQALANCTRRSLIPFDGVEIGELKEKWAGRIRDLEAEGVS